VRDLVTTFDTDNGVLTAVDGVSFQRHKGRTLGIVGESGCGKSVTAFSIMRLLPQPMGHIAGGQVLLDGVDLTKLPPEEILKVRGDRMGMIFQEPMTSLNPVYTVGSQIVEAIRLHQKMSRRAAKARAIELLDLVGIPAPS